MERPSLPGGLRRQMPIRSLMMSFAIPAPHGMSPPASRGCSSSTARP